MTRQVKVHLLWLATLGAAGSVALRADASTQLTCAVTSVAYDTYGGGGRMYLKCSGDANYYYAAAYSLGTGCAVQTLDTLKIWMSEAQSSLLTGKNLSFYYDTCGSSIRVINIGFELQQ